MDRPGVVKATAIDDVDVVGSAMGLVWKPRIRRDGQGMQVIVAVQLQLVARAPLVAVLAADVLRWVPRRCIQAKVRPYNDKDDDVHGAAQLTIRLRTDVSLLKSVLTGRQC